MIVVQVSDPGLRKALRRAAHPEEDVVVDARLALDAIDVGFPRLIVKGEDVRLPATPSRVPLLELDGATLRRWEVERRSRELPPTRLDFATERLGTLIQCSALEAWSGLDELFELRVA